MDTILYYIWNEDGSWEAIEWSNKDNRMELMHWMEMH